MGRLSTTKCTHPPQKILADKPDPGTPGGRLYKVRWKGLAASRDSWEPPSSFVPRYTTV